MKIRMLQSEDSVFLKLMIFMILIRIFFANVIPVWEIAIIIIGFSAYFILGYLNYYIESTDESIILKRSLFDKSMVVNITDISECSLYRVNNSISGIQIDLKCGERLIFQPSPNKPNLIEAMYAESCDLSKKSQYHITKN
ncbi:hypothetical protein ACYVMA_004530 [Vibrio parahaemolyticus]